MVFPVGGIFIITALIGSICFDSLTILLKIFDSALVHCQLAP
jgi:hypothetical protein